MKKFIFLIYVVILALVLPGCHGSENTSIADSELFEDNQQSQHKYIYTTDEDTPHAIDGTSLSIAETNNGYGIYINLVRLAGLYGKITHIDTDKNTASFVATDPSGNSIGGELKENDHGDILLTFTESTWEHLPNGTMFLFKKMV